MSKEKEKLEEKLFDDNHELDFLMNQGPERKKGGKIFIVIAILFVITAVLVVFNPILLNLNKDKILGIFSGKENVNKDAETGGEDNSLDEGPLLSGKLTLIDKRLGLLDYKVWSGNYGDELENEAVYYEAGVFGSGKYKGYTRIIFFSPQIGPGSPQIRILATKDYETYVLDGDPATVGGDKSQDPLYGFSDGKVAKVDLLDSEHPSRIDLGDSFNLYRGEIFIEAKELASSLDGSTWGWRIADLLDFKEEKNDFTDLKLLISDAYKKPVNYSELSKDYQAKIDKYIKYTDGRSGVVVVDSTGLPYKYYIGNKSAVISGMKSTDLVDSSGLYKNYGFAFPGACFQQSDALTVKGLSDDAFETVTQMKKDGVILYKLKDKNHPLLTLAYDEKTDFMYTADYNQPYTVTNTKDVRPSYEDYIGKTPLLFFKDPLGRWNMFVEYQYLMPGGCGKPVLYFYPEKPTQISVKFEVGVALSRDIPKYNDGWRILADENSNLADLQPEFTDCSEISSSLKGMEYASSACRENKYPYIYWSGDVERSWYPEQRDGWSVAREDLESFIGDKLEYIGLSEKERTDMLEYWIPEMLKKQAPYYKVSFVQDSEMSSFIPMEIVPQPKSFGRVFLDWLPLNKDIGIKPQELSQISRDGFTVIEWGGVKR